MPTIKHVKALASGKSRMDALRADIEQGGPSFSTFSPAGTWLAGSQGITPLGVAMGSAVYNISLRCRLLVLMGFERPTSEMESYVRAHMELRMHAFDRLRSEAAALGADGVIDVNIDQRVIGEGPLEFKVVGTAVKVADRPEGARKVPFTTDMSEQDYVKLRQAGGWPIDVVYGISVRWVRANWTSWLIQSGFWWTNTEIGQFASAMRDARRDAMKRMRANASRVGASHVVGANVWCEVIPVPRGASTIQDLLIVYFARGTGISMKHAPPTHQTPKPLMIMDLATGGVAPLSPYDGN